MWKCFVLFLVFLIPDASFGQQTQQLTNNSFMDWGPVICNGRIAWIGGYASIRTDSYSNNYIDYPLHIYLAENGKIRKLTSGYHRNIEVSIGEKYVVWTRIPVNDASSSISDIMYYDGNTIKQIQSPTTENSDPLTAGNNIIWEGRDVDRKRNLNWFNGEKTVVISKAFAQLDENKYDATGYGRISKEGFVYLDRYFGLCLFDFNAGVHKTIAKISNRDSAINTQIWISGRSVLYSRIHYQTGTHKPIYYIYRDGQNTALPDSLKEILHFDSTFIAWNDNFRSADALLKNLYIWKDGKNYLISQYPFTTVNTYPELADIKFAFQVDKQLYFSYLYYFNGKEIINLLIPDMQNYSYSFSKGSVVWNTYNDKVRDASEIYFYCNNTNDDSCFKFQPLADEPSVKETDNSKIYYDYFQQNFVIEIPTTSDKEQYNFALYDLRGRLLLTEKLNFIYGRNQHIIPALNLPQSIYLFRLDNLTKPDKSITKKLLITR